MPDDTDFILGADPENGSVDPQPQVEPATPVVEPAPTPYINFDDLAPEEPAAPTVDPEKARMQAEIEYWRSRGAYAPTGAPAPGTPAPDDARRALTQQFNEALARDPAEAMILAAQMGAQAAEQNLTKRFAVQAETTARILIDNFKAQKAASDPKVYKAITKELDAMIAQVTPEQLAQMTPGQIQAGLQMSYQFCKGNAFDRLVSKTATPTNQGAQRPGPDVPPNYSGGSGPSGGSGSTLTGKNDAEKETLDLGRMAGLSDEDLKDLLED